MSSELDELAQTIGGFLAHELTGEILADRIIAAGYRKLPHPDTPEWEAMVERAAGPVGDCLVDDYQGWRDEERLAIGGKIADAALRAALYGDLTSGYRRLPRPDTPEWKALVERAVSAGKRSAFWDPENRTQHYVIEAALRAALWGDTDD